MGECISKTFLGAPNLCKVVLYLSVMFESGPSGCFQLAPLTGSHQGAAATWQQNNNINIFWLMTSCFQPHPVSCFIHTPQGSSRIDCNEQNSRNANGFQYRPADGYTAPSQPYDLAAHNIRDEAVNSRLSGFCLREACCAQDCYNQSGNILKAVWQHWQPQTGTLKAV